MNFKEKLIRIGQSLLIGVFLLAIAFIFIGLKRSTTNWTFISIGIVILVPFGIYLLYLTIKFPKQDNEDLYEKYKHKLIQTADRVSVDLDKVIIKEESHTQTKIVSQDYKAAGLNELMGNGHYNEEKITSVSCEVTFKVKYKEKRLTLKETIYKDVTSVRMYFYMKKTTIAYINPQDPKEYYLDLEFIND